MSWDSSPRGQVVCNTSLTERPAKCNGCTVPQGFMLNISGLIKELKAEKDQVQRHIAGIDADSRRSRALTPNRNGAR